jgi:hopene-associated glycosyltransferase HpnB
MTHLAVFHTSSLLAAASLGIWLYLFVARGRFWQVRSFDKDQSAHAISPEWPRVVAIVPARNEADTIAQCVRSLLSQDYPGEFSVIVVDDQSEDGTASLAEQAARGTGAESRIHIQAASAVPGGWTGKLWALNEGVRSAGASDGTLYWFTDADVVHAPDTLRRLVSRAQRANLDLTSLMVLLRTETLHERALIPPFLFFFLMLYPPRWIADINSQCAGAAGGCILLRSTALERIGGLASICGEVIDDCALARVVKHSGGQIWMGLSRASVSLRAYASVGEILDMIARTAFTQLHYSAVFLLGALSGLFLAYFVPSVFPFSHDPVARILSAAAWALMTIAFLPTVRFYRLSPLWALLLPVAALFFVYATCVSAVRYWLGRGGQWKGRAQAQRV